MFLRKNLVINTYRSYMFSINTLSNLLLTTEIIILSAISVEKASLAANFDFLVFCAFFISLNWIMLHVERLNKGVHQMKHDERERKQGEIVKNKLIQSLHCPLWIKVWEPRNLSRHPSAV